MQWHYSQFDSTRRVLLQQGLPEQQLLALLQPLMAEGPAGDTRWTHHAADMPMTGGAPQHESSAPGHTHMVS
jgi:hypothetical protein